MAPPCDDEVFGIGGETNWIPAEAADGAAVDGAVTAVSGMDYAVLDDTDTVYFQDGDTYRIENAAGTFCVEATAEEFFTNLSEGDNLETHSGVAAYGASDAPYNQDAANEYCLEDLAPAGLDRCGSRSG